MLLESYMNAIKCPISNKVYGLFTLGLLTFKAYYGVGYSGLYTLIAHRQYGNKMAKKAARAKTHQAISIL